jgi:hypothetical protein
MTIFLAEEMVVSDIVVTSGRTLSWNHSGAGSLRCKDVRPGKRCGVEWVL